MAIHSWPSTDIMDALPVASAAFIPHRQREYSQAGGGTVYRAELAPSLWSSTIKSVPLYHANAEQAKALIGSMEDQLATFYVWNPMLAYPQSDTAGTGLGASAPVIASIDADNKRITISGLPAAYVLTRGDYLVVTRAADGKRQLFQAVDATVTADGTGLTPLFEVTPFIRTGMAVGDAVTLYKPGCEMVIIPGSLNISTMSEAFSQVSFQAIEAP